MAFITISKYDSIFQVVTLFVVPEDVNETSASKYIIGHIPNAIPLPRNRWSCRAKS